VKLKFIFLCLFFITTFLIFFQCSSNKVVPNICFNKDILPIFISKCTTSGCHSSLNGQNAKGGDFTSYEGILKKVKPYYPLFSEVYTECNGENPNMPPAPNTPLTSKELDYIKYWIHIGAKNTIDCGGYECDTINISFSKRVQPLLNTWCLGCHNSNNAGGGFDLSNYDGVKKTITPDNRLIGSIFQLINFDPMPKGTGKLNDCDLIAIKKWVNEGYQNN